MHVCWLLSLCDCVGLYLRRGRWERLPCRCLSYLWWGFEQRWVGIALLFMVLAGFADVGCVIGVRCW